MYCESQSQLIDYNKNYGMKEDGIIKLERASDYFWPQIQRIDMYVQYDYFCSSHQEFSEYYLLTSLSLCHFQFMTRSRVSRLIVIMNHANKCDCAHLSEKWNLLLRICFAGQHLASVVHVVPCQWCNIRLSKIQINQMNNYKTVQRCSVVFRT